MLTSQQFTKQSGESLVPCACPRCGASEVSLVHQTPDRQFEFPSLFCASKCRSCGLLHQNPRIPLDQLGRHYPNEYCPYSNTMQEINLDDAVISHLVREQGYTHLNCDLQPTFRQRRYGRAGARSYLIPDFAPGGKVLEFGCAAGNRLALFKRLGWSSCIGSEYSDVAATMARARGLDVKTGPVEAALESFPNGSLDAVVGGYVIEHLVDPFATTRAIAAKLKSGGHFLFSTINIDSPDYWLYGAYWYDLDMPRHMVFFRKQDLRAMLAPDFEIEALLFECGLNDYLGSARYRARDNVGGLRGLFDKALLRLGNRIARPIRLIARAGLGGRIYVIARKR